MAERKIEVDRIENIINVFGSFDQNIRIIEAELGVIVTDRDSELRISGEEADVALAEKAIEGLISLAARGENIDAQNVRYILKLVREGKELKIGEISSDTVCVMDQVGDEKNTSEGWLEQIALKDAMKKLTPRERNILTLRFYDGKTQMEVANEIGISQALVSRLEKSAITTIRKEIMPS